MLADAGYVDFGYFEQLSLSGGQKLREISRKDNRAEVLDC
ncbi:hypothetical protein XNW1_740001 [Xenorhabdus nematophila str. Websteri]|nr:hypothetical protein XNW1_4380001 [Xenorhabdus nematophila str. Websteri]CEF33942.1 hypothetical protein XNW1_740001 [Xenorhabdus nematophila str. Websteri]